VPAVWGYSLKVQKWGWVLLAGVQPINWEANPLDSIVIPCEHKEVKRPSHTRTCFLELVYTVRYTMYCRPLCVHILLVCHASVYCRILLYSRVGGEVRACSWLPERMRFLLLTHFFAPRTSRAPQPCVLEHPDVVSNAADCSWRCWLVWHACPADAAARR
jgi:hypothetical protein